MASYVTLFCIGFIFAIGLGVSGMTLPQRVLGFLNLSSNWDPALLFVMISALVVSAIFVVFAKKRSRPILAKEFHWPTKTKLDRPLMIGATIFGIGWGLAGYCPGPAIVASAAGSKEALVFLLSMFCGMALFLVYDKRRGS